MKSINNNQQTTY